MDFEWVRRVLFRVGPVETSRKVKKLCCTGWGAFGVADGELFKLRNSIAFESAKVPSRTWGAVGGVGRQGSW